MKKIALLAFITLGLWSCSTEEDSDSGTQQTNFDRKAMMVNLADNIIIPAFEDLDLKLTQLTTDQQLFATTPNQVNLDQLRASWLAAYKTWQYVEMFNIGKAEEILYSFQMNVYPTNVNDITNNIASGSYDIGSANNNDAVGFPAVEYMIYGLADSDSALISSYTTDADAAKNKKYLSDLTTRMKTLTSTVLNDWKTSYRSRFVESTDNNATSAINMLINDFIFYYEKQLRANKIGIPAGVFSSAPLPDLVEGNYSKTYSRELALEALKAVQDFFIGKSYGTPSIGSGYANYVDATTDVALSTMITDQFSIARSSMGSLNADLSQQVITDNSKMTKTYDDLQRAVVLMKVDMLQTLNISVDYVDADGD